MPNSFHEEPTQTRGHAGMYGFRNNYGDNVNYANAGGSILARVVAVNWASRTIDCIGIHNQAGSGPWLEVPVLSSVFSQSEGTHWFPFIDQPANIEIEKITKVDGEHDAVAVLMFIGNSIFIPVCIGFVTFGPNEFSFEEPGMKIERHASDIYSMITMDPLSKEGLYELSFPDGTYIKIGNPKKGKNLTDWSLKNADSKIRPWKPRKNDPKKSIVIHHSSGCEIIIDEQGEVNVTSPKSVSINAPAVTIVAATGDVIVQNKSLVNHTHTFSSGNVSGTTSTPQ